MSPEAQIITRIIALVLLILTAAFIKGADDDRRD